MSKPQLYLLGSIFTLTFLSSCTKLADPGIPEVNPWQKVEVNSSSYFLDSYVTPHAFYLLTNDEFFRFDKQLNIVEKRLIPAPNLLYGNPEISDICFVRLTKNLAGRQVLEFHLTKTAGEVRSFSTDDLKSNAAEIVQIDFLGRSIACFNVDGTKVLIPAVTFPNYHYSFFLFEIKYDPQTFHFSSMEVKKRIEIPEMISEYNNLSSIRSFGTDYYIASKNGAFIINAAGQVRSITTNWMRDFFTLSGKIYATAFSDSDMMVSGDSGKTWQRISTTSKMRLVTQVGTQLLSQDQIGNPFEVAAGAEFSELIPLQLNKDFPADPSSYRTLSYFNGDYYLSVGSQLYQSDSLRLHN